jgi:hypothetical protein
VLLAPHSIFVCVDGGTDAAVAATLLQNKSLGAGWNGTTAVAIIDPASGQPYTVRFQRPTIVDVQARVTVKVIGAVNDVVAAVQTAITNFAAGLVDGEAGFVVGASVSPFELAGAVARQVPGVYVQRVEVSLLTPTTWSTNEIPISITQLAKILAANVLVVVV